MDSNTDLLRKFYSAFQQLDYRAMQSLYHDEATFSDPVFQQLNSAQVKAMWQMLLGSATDLKIDFREITTAGETGKCHWEAWYTFSSTGRRVHNVIEASFVFRDGRIYRHIDRFDLWRWSRQALGWSGILLGWTPSVQNQIRARAKHRLDSFMKKN